MIASRSNQTALAIEVGGERFALPVAVVRRIGYAANPAAIPFVPDWVEGLTWFDHRAVVQIDPARALTGAPGVGGKVALVDCPGGGGVIALRVESVTWADTSAPDFPLGTLVRDFVAAPGRRLEPQPAAVSGGGTQSRSAELVLVAECGGTRLGILVEEGMTVGEAAAGVAVDTGDGGSHPMAVFGNCLLPAYRLAGTVAGATLAVKGRIADDWGVVLVDRIASLEHVAARELTLIPDAAPGRNLCFRLAGGPPVCLHDFSALAGGRDGPRPPYQALLDRVRDLKPRAPGNAGGALRTGGGPDHTGLMVSVGDACWLLPFGLVARVMTGIAKPERRPSGLREGTVPLVDAGRWLPSRGRPPVPWGAQAAAVLRLSNGSRMALLVDRTALEPPGAGPPWLPPPALPAGLAALVEAVRHDPDTGRWCLRLVSDLDPAALPRAVRRAVAAAALGRITPGLDLQTIFQGAHS